MLRFSKLNKFWTNLPSGCNLKSLQTPTIVYIYKNAQEKLGEIAMLKRLAESKSVCMYKEHYTRIPPEIYSHCEISTIPTLVAILWGKCVGQVTLKNIDKCSNILNLLLESKSEPLESHDEDISQSLELYDNKNVTLEELHAQNETLVEIFKDPVVKLHGPLESQLEKIETIKRHNGYKEPCNIMAKISQDIACKEAMSGNLEKALEICLEHCHMYKEIPQLSHALVKLLPSEMALQLLAEAKLLDTNIVHATQTPGRPVGGVARKRRGFRGKYVWHGPDYRPKRYKPKDLKAYYNEWVCYQDKNLPL